MITPDSNYALRHKAYRESLRFPCFPRSPRHLRSPWPRHSEVVPQPSRLRTLTREEIDRRRGGNPKGAY